MAKRTSLQGFWSSRLAFILAVTGSAVGLGNIWKFPYVTGEYGGGAFVLMYLAFVFIIGLPTMMSEILIGRRGRRNPVTTMQLVGEEESGRSAWKYVGLMGVCGGILILSYYSVVAGWAVAYIPKAASGAFVGSDAATVKSLFNTLTGDPWALLGWHSLFMGLTVFVVARGVERGLEQAVRILMPALVIMLVILLVYSIRHGDFMAAVNYMFRPNWDDISFEGALVALGQALFTLSVGMGAVMAYGAYLPEETNIGTAAITVVLADTTIAILAGLVIFPVVFGFGMAAGGGPGLIFQTLPLAFGGMPGGVVFGTVFFVLLSFAAWTSAIGLIEPAVAWANEQFSVPRSKATLAIGGLIWLIGVLSVLSFNVLKDEKYHTPLGTLFDTIEFITSNVMLPLGALLIVIFAGWVMCRNSTSDELKMGSGLRYDMWRFAARYIAPIAVIAVFLHSLGLLSRFTNG
ncbi:MAG: sodium-dependent transporter [Gammaproteobacteria bacterium]|nr:sodium-dependent transporter [Gammaproteobacteria bacterium]